MDVQSVFFNQSLGLLLVGIGIVTGVVKLSKNNTYSFLPTMVLVGLMVIGVAAMDAGLCFVANRMKKRNAMICFIVSFFMILIMGYLSSKDFDSPLMNWVAQGVNIVGQLLHYIGAIILDKAGLKDI